MPTPIRHRSFARVSLISLGLLLVTWGLAQAQEEERRGPGPEARRDREVPRREARGRGEELREMFDQLSEHWRAGRREQAERLMRALSNEFGRRGPEDREPPQGARQEERREQDRNARRRRVASAVENLEAAGLRDLAQHVREHAQELLGDRPRDEGPRPDGPRGDVPPNVERLSDMVNELHAALRGMQERLQDSEAVHRAVEEGQRATEQLRHDVEQRTGDIERMVQNVTEELQRQMDRRLQELERGLGRALEDLERGVRERLESVQRYLKDRDEEDDDDQADDDDEDKDEDDEDEDD